jgi:hypothetical protein
MQRTTGRNRSAAAAVEERRAMTIGMFLVALGVASALLAFWFVVRFPDLGPGDAKRAMIHVFAALALGWFVPDIFNQICAHGYVAALLALFGLVVPVVFYTFLSGAWWLRIATGAMNQYRH